MPEELAASAISFPPWMAEKTKLRFLPASNVITILLSFVLTSYIPFLYLPMFRQCHRGGTAVP